MTRSLTRGANSEMHPVQSAARRLTRCANATEPSRMNDPGADDSSAASGDTISRWYDGFRASAHFERLPDAHRERAWGIIDLFATYSFDYTGESPGQWSAAGVRECCLQILPRKITGDAALFKAVAPVLSAFFLHLDERQLQKGGRALARWSPLDQQPWPTPATLTTTGRRLTMQALAAGVDINNQEELNAHLLRGETVLAKPREHALGVRPPAIQANTPAPPGAEPKVSGMLLSAAGRNTKCCLGKVDRGRPAVELSPPQPGRSIQPRRRAHDGRPEGRKLVDPAGRRNLISAGRHNRSLR